MMWRLKQRISLTNSHQQSRAHQASWHRRTRRPTHDFSRMQVQHVCQIQPAATRSDVGHIANPSLVGLDLLKQPVQHDRAQFAKISFTDRL